MNNTNGQQTTVLISFKNTEHALAWGTRYKGNLGFTMALKQQREYYLKEVQSLLAQGKESEAFYLASGQSQLTREALEAMEESI